MLYHVCMDTITRIARETGEPDLRYSKRKKQTVCARFDPDLRRDVDAYARKRGMDRTTVMEEACRVYLRIKALDQEPSNGR
jgi:hypothetical protein